MLKGSPWLYIHSYRINKKKKQKKKKLLLISSFRCMQVQVVMIRGAFVALIIYENEKHINMFLIHIWDQLTMLDLWNVSLCFRNQISYSEIKHKIFEWQLVS